MTDADHASGSAWDRSIVERFEGPLVRFAERITGDVESARDVVQETFLRLFAGNRASVDGHEAQWLFTVCRRRALDVAKKEQRMNLATDRQLAGQHSPAPGPAAIVERGETAGTVLSLLATLPANQQEVVRLRFQNGLSYREIAGVTQLSVSNVGFLMHTAIKTIRRRLAAPADARGETRSAS